ncbi:oxysterol-binding protein-related protein 1-like [Ylistrum balloti]|uniref:oxysterol-binding protein-related protein 1-like n=1 Tax=Ylistrum balloti TaxID=509963 RepID=UPI002905D18A|nr:oxysterol-binding protein-related protein 1-like [Ylistrum balloti]
MAESDSEIFHSDNDDNGFHGDVVQVEENTKETLDKKDEYGSAKGDIEENDVSKEDMLLLSARNGDMEAVQRLVKQQINGEISLDLNCTGNSKANRGWTALHLATYFGHTCVVKLLLENGADVNVVNPNGDTPLHKAAFTGRMETLTLLLQFKADVGKINDEGQTPEMIGKTKEIKDLLEAALGHESLRRQTEFLAAARSGDVDAVQELLASDRPPNINTTDQYGNTALHIAAQADQRDMVIFLLQNSVDSSIKNLKDQTAIDFARTNQMRQLLTGVRPVKEFTFQPQRCEGLLLKKSRFLGYKPVWVVLERGVLSYFRNRGDASTGVKRKGMKYLDEAKILVSTEEKLAQHPEFLLHYSDGTNHCFSTEQGEEASILRQKWLNALKEHINYSTHYIHQGEDQPEGEIVSLGSLKDTLKTAQAHHQLLEKESNQLSLLLGSMEKDKTVTFTEGGMVDIHQKVKRISDLSRDTACFLNHCLTLFVQQEEVRSLQLKDEMEKSRVLQEALHALATEHHELEQTLSFTGRKSPARYYDTDDDEFYDCDDDSLGNNEKNEIAESVTGNFLDAMSFESAKSGSYFPTHIDGTNGCVQSRYGRSRLPVPMFDRNDFSIWSILKQCIGKELSKITMPVVFNEPLSFIQRISEYMEYTSLLEKASLASDPAERFAYVSAFAVSAISSNWDRIGKPFNPLLGETFELNRSDLGFRLVGEQVSHHPPVSAFLVESKQFKIHGSIHPKLKFWGKSVEINPKGTITLELTRHGEVYTWSNVNCCVHNVIVGKIWIEHYGVMEILCHKTGWKSILNFKQSGWFGKDLHKVEGYIYDKSKVKRKALYGSWVYDLFMLDAAAYDDYMKNSASTTSPSHSAKSNGASGSSDVNDDLSAKRLSTYDLHIPGQECIWTIHPRPEKSPQYFSFTLFAMALNELNPDTAGQLAPTDSRFRPDIRLLEEGQIDAAAAEKNRIEEKQRSARKERKRKKDEWIPVFFKIGTNPHTGKEDWLFKGNYWDRDWSKCPDIF